MQTYTIAVIVKTKHTQCINDQFMHAEKYIDLCIDIYL